MRKAPGVSSGALLEGVTLDLTRRSRIVLVGRNGSGKSTLLKLIAAAAGAGGEGADGVTVIDGTAEGLVPTAGSIVRNYNARVGLFTQVTTCPAAASSMTRGDSFIYCVAPIHAF